MKIYTLDLSRLAMAAVLVMAVWGVLWWASGRRWVLRLAFVLSNVLLAVVALYGILLYTVFGRESSDEHVLVLSMDFTHNEFVREMFMNALLYLPLGVTLSAPMGSWAAPVGLALSAGIERWQYITGAGTAQATDVLCNAFGCAMGVLPRVLMDSGLWKRLMGVCAHLFGRLRGLYVNLGERDGS